MSQRVTAHSGALYSKPRRSQKRRRCDGHLTDRHWIEPGDLAIWSALPPHDNDIGNIDWCHHVYCMDCAPLETTTPPPAPLTSGASAIQEQA